MYIYRRLRTSKSAVTIILIALALACLGSSGTHGHNTGQEGQNNLRGYPGYRLRSKPTLRLLRFPSRWQPLKIFSKPKSSEADI